MRLVMERLGVEGPIESLLVVCDEAGVVHALEFGDDEAGLRRGLDARYPGAVVENGPAPAAVRRALDAYLRGDLQALDGLPVATSGTPFQRAVWTALRRIPAGTTTSYGALAAAIGRPAAVRATGLAVGANPVAVIVPCHRVIGADRSLTGFAGGLARKRWLLEHEGHQLRGRSGAGERVHPGSPVRAPELAL